MDQQQRLALNVMADSMSAGAEALRNHGNPFADSYSGPIDSWIKPEQAQEIRDLLDEARSQTPAYIRGTIVSPAAMSSIYAILREIERDLEWGAKFHHCVNGDAKASDAQMAGVLSSLVKRFGRD